MHSSPSRIAGLAALVLAGLAEADSGSFLSDQDARALKPDIGATCLIAAQMFAGMGDLLEVRLSTSAGELTTSGFNGGLLSGGADGFAFVNVPKGPFRVKEIAYARAKQGPGGAVSERRTFTNDGAAHAMGGNTGTGDVPDEMSGTCEGGFVWLGVFKGNPGGTFSAPSLERGSDASAAQVAQAAMKAKLAGSPWAAAIDKPAKNTPLPKGQAIVVKIDEKANAEEGAKAVAKMTSQTRKVGAPPSDEGAVEAAAGTYVLTAINGKPVPYVLSNSCKMLDGKYELRADASYSAAANLECGGKKIPFPTSGLFGVSGGKVTFAVAVGPPPGAAKTTLSGDTLTTVAGADAYAYKKQ